MAIQTVVLNNEVSEFWSNLGRKADRPRQGVSRVSSMTLIALADAEDDSAGFSETLAGLMSNHPGRAIVIRVANGDSEELKTEVREQRGVPAGEQKQVCGEQIEISASKKSIGELPSVLFPLLPPEVPVVLWCRSERSTQLPVFNRIVQLAPRVIFDIAGFRDRLAALTRIESIFNDDFAVTDLNWTRLTRWRDLISQVFENQVWPKDLPRLRQATISYLANPVSPVPVAAILLAGWLTNCLGWTGKGRSRREGGKRIIEFEDGASLIYQIVGPGGTGSRLASLSIAAPNDPAIEIKFTHVQGRHLDVIVNAAGSPASENRTSFPPNDDVSLLGEELSATRRDSIFASSLGTAIRIAEHWA